jgi:hypothetical protein
MKAKPAVRKTKMQVKNQKFNNVQPNQQPQINPVSTKNKGPGGLPLTAPPGSPICLSQKSLHVAFKSLNQHPIKP